MQTKTISSSAQLAVALQALQEWWNAKSVSFSQFTGEQVSHGEVVVTNLVFFAGVAAMILAGVIFGG